MRALALLLYATVLRLATPLYLWRVWARGRQEPTYRWHWWERLGWYGAAHRALVAAIPRSADSPLVWLHAVSLGEARAAEALVRALRTQCPGMRLLITHGTATGRAAGQALREPTQGDVQTWMPYDTPGAVRRFLRLHRPDVGVLMETEVWPVMQHEARRAGVPMVLANARLSDKSLRQGQRLAWLMQPALQAMSLVLAQTEDDARRLRTLLGHPPQPGPSVQVCGNVKFDMSPAPALLALGQSWRDERPVVLAASTREGEEPGLLAAWQTRWGADQATTPGAAAQPAPRPRLCIVPRHPQRFDEVASLVRSAGWSLSRRSEWPGGQPDAQARAADVWLGDSMGEMPAYFALARVALLGGSFAPLGGQNLIEAAACGCPIVMGPSTFNFAEAAQLSEAAGAATRVQGWEQGVGVATQMAVDAEDAARVARCLAFARAHQGAALHMAQAILAVCTNRGRRG